MEKVEKERIEDEGKKQNSVKVKIGDKRGEGWIGKTRKMKGRRNVE